MTPKKRFAGSATAITGSSLDKRRRRRFRITCVAFSPATRRRLPSSSAAPTPVSLPSSSSIKGFGDLFVIRVAGNIVAPSQVGSVEFAASKFGTKLVVVMGHSQCGAITAAVEELLDGATNQSRNLRSIVDRVRPAVEGVIAGRRNVDRKTIVRDAVIANVKVSVDHLRHGSELLEKLIQTDGLVVVGAKYSLDTGVVAILDG